MPVLEREHWEDNERPGIISEANKIAEDAWKHNIHTQAENVAQQAWNYDVVKEADEIVEQVWYDGTTEHTVYINKELDIPIISTVLSTPYFIPEEKWLEQRKIWSEKMDVNIDMYSLSALIRLRNVFTKSKADIGPDNHDPVTINSFQNIVPDPDHGEKVHEMLVLDAIDHQNDSHLTPSEKEGLIQGKKSVKGGYYNEPRNPLTKIKPPLKWKIMHITDHVISAFRYLKEPTPSHTVIHLGQQVPYDYAQNNSDPYYHTPRTEEQLDRFLDRTLKHSDHHQ